MQQETKSLPQHSNKKAKEKAHYLKLHRIDDLII